MRWVDRDGVQVLEFDSLEEEAAWRAEQAASVPVVEELVPVGRIEAEVKARLDDPAVNTIAEVKRAILDGLAAAKS